MFRLGYLMKVCRTKRAIEIEGQQILASELKTLMLSYLKCAPGFMLAILSERPSAVVPGESPCKKRQRESPSEIILAGPKRRMFLKPGGFGSF